MNRALSAIGLLIASNVFMTAAWYGHLKQRAWPLWMAIILSWLIALPEYALQVPANRLGHANFGGPLTAPQLKVIQEAITLVIFGIFSTLVLRERLKWNALVAFALVFVAVMVSVFGDRIGGMANGK